ncbi:hypothetical protein I4U23_016610 [Adineta vaga]|nr:hypothetical protein I4U23_016610 [Adineta vaga]
MSCCLFIHIFQVVMLLFTVSSITAQMPDPSQLPPALRTFYLTIISNLNETLNPPNSTLAIHDPRLFQALTNLHRASFPALDIISNLSIPNNTWVTYNQVKEFNRLGVEVLDLLSARVLTRESIPQAMELAAMEDVINFIELSDKSPDEQVSKQVQPIVNSILEKLPNRRLNAYTVVGINSTLSDAQSRSNYILVFAGLRALDPVPFHAVMTHEIGHGELSHILQGSLARVFNDMLWSPIAPQIPGLQSQADTSTLFTAEQKAAAQILPLLVSAAQSRRNELEADAFAIKMGVSKLGNPCGMVDAIRKFNQNQQSLESLPFDSHPNSQDRLKVALKVAADEGAGLCSGATVVSGPTVIIVMIIICLYNIVRIVDSE